jgi:hypothetical protein
MLVQAALRLGVAPCFSARVPAPWHEALPELAAMTRRIRHTAAVRNLVVKATRTRALQVAAHAGVDLVLLKGAVLGPLLYDHPDERAMTDVDVLVSTSGASRLGRALRVAGFARVGRDGGAHAEDFFEQTYRAPRPYWGLLDVHNHPCERAYFQVDVMQWLERKRAAPTLDGVLPGLSPEDTLLHLALHAASHGFDLDLRTFVDGVRLMARHAPSVGAVAAQASAIGADVPLWLFLSILRDLLGWPDAAGWVERLAPGRWRRAWLKWRVGWERGQLHAYRENNRARIITGIFPLLQSPSRAAAFGGVYLSRRVALMRRKRRAH